MVLGADLSGRGINAQGTIGLRKSKAKSVDFRCESLRRCSASQICGLSGETYSSMTIIGFAASSGSGAGTKPVKRNPFAADRQLLLALEKRSQPVFCDDGCTLFCQGETANGLYILLSGEASLMMKSSAGRMVMCLHAASNSILGLPAIMAGTPYSLTAIARKGSDIRYVSREDFEALIQADPSLSLMVFNTIAKEIVAARKALADLL